MKDGPPPSIPEVGRGVFIADNEDGKGVRRGFGGREDGGGRKGGVML